MSDTAAEEKARIKSASDRGTAYHRALELIHFAEISGCDDIVKELDRIREEKRMQETAIDMVYPGVLTKFFHSDIAARMKQADRNGKLQKESQFVVGIPAREMNKADSDALILLQGIIDAWFEEVDGLVLVDYKTDRVKEGRREYTSGPLPDPALLLRKGTCPDHREKGEGSRDLLSGAAERDSGPDQFMIRYDQKLARAP